MGRIFTIRIFYQCAKSLFFFGNKNIILLIIWFELTTRIKKWVQSTYTCHKDIDNINQGLTI